MTTKTSIYDLVGDLVVYRDLDPVDSRLPRFSEAWPRMGLTAPARPRKLDLAYAQALAWLLTEMRGLDAPGLPVRELVFIGDNLSSDGSAFRNLRAAGDWRGWAFIGADRAAAPAMAETDGITTANRWVALSDFLAVLLRRGARLDRQTIVVLDIDKTLIGARGRNDSAIDGARIAAIEATVADALGEAFDRERFRKAYAAINVAQYHPFTADNQDNVAYTCLMLGAGVANLDDLIAQIDAGSLTSFRAFIDQVDANRDRLPSPGLRALHDDIYARVLADDATPFKAFRRREYRETVARMGYLPDDVSTERMLIEEVCITRETLEAAAWLRARGCLLTALSDKPDEATMPAPELVAQGFMPLHRVSAHIVGPSIGEALAQL
jgi:hypothetical protein